MRLRDAEEAERERLAAAEADVVRVRENLEIATAERAAMQDALQASKKRLVEAYDEQSERKRALKKTEQELELQNVQLEEQKKKMQEMVARRKAEVGAIEAEMNKLRAESQQISEGQKQWLQQVCVCVCAYLYGGTGKASKPHACMCVGRCCVFVATAGTRHTHLYSSIYVFLYYICALCMCG